MTSTAGGATVVAGGGGGGDEGPAVNMTLSEALQKWVSKHPDKVVHACRNCNANKIGLSAVYCTESLLLRYAS